MEYFGKTKWYLHNHLSRCVALLILCILYFNNPASAQYRTYHDASAVGNNCYRLTSNNSFVAGAILSQQQYSVDSDFTMACTLNFGINDVFGGDGFGFIMLPDPNALNSNQQTGEGIGYKGLANSLVIEFDTYQNTALADPTFDHIALVARSNPDHNTATIAGPFPAASSGNVEDGLDHDLLIIWEAQLQLLTVYFDCQKVFGYQGDIVRPFLGGSRTFYAGFTASTGGATNEQYICFKTPQEVDNLRDQTFCDSATVVLDAGANARVVSWTPDELFASPHQVRNKVVVTETTTYYLHKWDDCGDETIDSVTINIVPNPLNIFLGNDTVICGNASLVLSVADGGLNYNWSTGATTQSITINQPGTYSVIVDDGLCYKEDEINVGEKSLPQIQLPQDTLLCDHEPYVISVYPNGANIRWQDDSQDSIYTITVAGDYQVSLENECGVVLDQIRVSYDNCSLFYIPNAFTPNHDGTNDYFGPAAGSSIIQIEEMLIFDRWGAQVFAAHAIDPHDETKLWDGSFKSKMANPGTYVYLIRMRMKNGKIITAKGDVTLIQ